MVTIIAAMTKDRVIGNDNSLLWNIPEDLKNFKETTEGHVVIMGRKTYDSLPEKFRPLPNRHNIVISRSMPVQENIDVCRDIEDALYKARSYGTEIFIIGGATIYKQMMSHCDKMILSFVKEKYEGDAHFPEFDKNEWSITSKKDFNKFELRVYKRLTK